MPELEEGNKNKDSHDHGPDEADDHADLAPCASGPVLDAIFFAK